MQMITQGEKVQVLLDGDLSVANAAEMKDILLAALSGTDLVEVDLAKVTHMDLASLQLICSAHRTAKTSGKDLILTGTSNGVLLQTRKSAGFIRHQGCIYNPTKSCLWVGGVK